MQREAEKAEKTCSARLKDRAEKTGLKRQG
jgi:hypothetical protein